MNVLIVDTSIWIAYFSGNFFPDLDTALEEGRVFLPPLVCSELLSGQMNKSQRADLIELLRELPPCDNSIDHWIRVGQLRRELKQKGLSLSTPDAHIAQCALDLGGLLYSTDKVFHKIPKSFKLRILKN